MVTDSDSPAETANATLSLTVVPPCPAQGTLNVIISGPLRSATDHKTVVAKVTNTGTSAFTICGTDISWTVTVGSVTQDTKCATLAPGGSTRFRNTWTWTAGQVVAGQSYTVTGTIVSPISATDSETRIAK
jgi:hypothetical protein